MKRYQVRLSRDALNDLQSLHDYLAADKSVALADRLLERLLDVARSLTLNPDRGSCPRELLDLGEDGYRQLVFKPWRVVYSVDNGTVHILLIADGRRDMRSLLAQRLLSA